VVRLYGWRVYSQRLYHATEMSRAFESPWDEMAVMIRQKRLGAMAADVEVWADGDQKADTEVHELA
jgi:hypothetical protein